MVATRTNDEIVWAVSDALEGLPQDVEGIRRLLRTMEIRGWSGSPVSCPIANYVRKVAEYDHISVNSSRCTVGLVGDARTITLKYVVHDFIEAFDSGAFPELKEPWPIATIMKRL